MYNGIGHRIDPAQTLRVRKCILWCSGNHMLIAPSSEAIYVSAVQRDMGMQADGESDELKRVLLEGNPIFLAITFAVSMLHSVFDVLAFKNDIGFWRNKKSVEGLSVRTVGINCFCQVRTLLNVMCWRPHCYCSSRCPHVQLLCFFSCAAVDANPLVLETHWLATR